jgi:hypothetical protein
MEPSRVAGIIVQQLNGKFYNRTIEYQPNNSQVRVTATDVRELIPTLFNPGAKYIFKDNFNALITKRTPEIALEPKYPEFNEILGSWTGGWIKGDDRGHILPHLLGGIDADPNNFFWQNYKTNRGAYNKFGQAVADNELQDLDDDYFDQTENACVNPDPEFPVTLSYEVTFRYKPLDTSLRPDMFAVKVTDNTGKIRRIGLFPNLPSK